MISINNSYCQEDVDNKSHNFLWYQNNVIISDLLKNVDNIWLGTMNWHCSLYFQIEFGSSVEDINEETIEELEDYINCSSSSLTPIPSIPKSHSLAVMTPLPDEEEEADDSKYEGILMTNIKLWKCSQLKSSLKTWWLCVCFVIFVSHRSLIYYMYHVHKSYFVF